MKDYKKKFLVPLEVHHERMRVCKECVHCNKGICSKCGCILNFKTRLKGTECPIGKW